jgi:hypothetical protein
MKVCRGCGENKPLIEYHKYTRSSDGHQARCKVCKSGHYRENKESYRNNIRAADKKRLLEVRTYILQYLLNHPCQCGQSDPLLLEFDHNEPANKFMTISQMVRDRYGLSKIKEEIEKCTVRCLYCHRKRTAEQFGWWLFNAFVD